MNGNDLKYGFKARNEHLVAGVMQDHFGHVKIKLKDESVEWLTCKEAWKLGYISWVDVHFSGGNGRRNFRESIEEIFNRWIRFKKEASEAECIAVFEKLKQTILYWDYSTRYNIPHFGRCGIYWEKYRWEKKPYKCAKCGNLIETEFQDYVFCNKCYNVFYKYCTKNKISSLDRSSAESYINNQMKNLVKQIERGKYNGITRTGN